MSTGAKKRVAQEGDIPGLAKDALRKAYTRALESGSSVLEVVNGQLVKSNPDGTRITLRAVKPGKAVTLGKKINLGK